MNAPQELWWEQARSDYEAWQILRKAGCHPCHELHYLQMITEKVAKAYLWKVGKAPPKSHRAFVNFLRQLASFKDQAKQQQVAQALDIKPSKHLVRWVEKFLPLAHEIENLAPDLSNEGPNPEYPWPHQNPTDSPVGYAASFSAWQKLWNTARGRDFLNVRLRLMVMNLTQFP